MEGVIRRRAHTRTTNTQIHTSLEMFHLIKYKWNILERMRKCLHLKVNRVYTTMKMLRIRGLDKCYDCNNKNNNRFEYIYTYILQIWIQICIHILNENLMLIVSMIQQFDFLCELFCYCRRRRSRRCQIVCMVYELINIQCVVYISTHSAFCLARARPM